MSEETARILGYLLFFSAIPLGLLVWLHSSGWFHKLALELRKRYPASGKGQGN